MVASSMCDVVQYSLSVLRASFSQAAVAQRCLLAPVVEHGRPPVLLKARYKPLGETRPTTTFGNAFDFEAVLMKYLQRDRLQCATPACTAPPRHESDTCPLTLQRA